MSSEFDIYQQNEIRLGKSAGIDTKLFENSSLHWCQMRQIRLGLEKGLDTSSYNDTKLTPEEMNKIRKKLEDLKYTS
jgi:hypothetical protein